MEIFRNTRLLVGEDKFKKITNTSVLIIGVGGVGGHAVECLSRLGICKIILVDGDIVENSNINRQIIALNSTIGFKKVDLLKKRIKDINSKCEVITIDSFLNLDNIDIIFQYNSDFIIDACDSLHIKKQLILKCYNNKKINFISSMGMGNRIDGTKVKLTTLNNTSNDPISKILRRDLKKENINLNKINVVFSEELPLVKKSKYGFVTSLSYVPCIAGSFIANFVVNKIQKGLRRDK